VIREFGLLLSASVALSFTAAHVVVRLLAPREESPADRSQEPGLPGTKRKEVSV
jgi:hypothetical protein